MNVRSYEGKVFVVESSLSVIRDDNLVSVKYQPGDDLPPGKHVGDEKLIPKRTEITVTGVKSNKERQAFVFARPANDSASSFGWTSVENLVDDFTNETAGFAPDNFSVEPDGNNKTCVDANALVRLGPPDFTSTGQVIPQRSFVMVTETSADKKNVKVSKLEIVDGQMVTKDEIGWTRLSNLRDGCSDLFFSTEWADDKGPNACWEHGTFIGAKLLVNIVGFGGDMEQVTFDSLDHYFELRNAAAENSIEISINSAFRTFERQAELRHLADIGKGNRAAKAGRSDHQHGQAFDLNTLHNKLDGSDKVYEWLKRNATKHGFVRAVSGESWHWEYRPAEVAKLAPGQFMLPGIHDG
jgi:hypothetical protein